MFLSFTFNLFWVCWQRKPDLLLGSFQAQITFVEIRVPPVSLVLTLMNIHSMQILTFLAMLEACLSSEYRFKYSTTMKQHTPDV